MLLVSVISWQLFIVTVSTSDTIFNVDYSFIFILVLIIADNLLLYLF